MHPGKLRWLRALGWGLGLIVIIVGAGTLVGILASLAGIPKTGPAALIHVVPAVTASLAIYFLAIRLGEKRRVTELAPGRLPLELTAGLLGGMGLFALTMTTLYTAGFYDVSAGPPGPPWKGLALSIVSGPIEELVFRAVILRLLWEAFGLRVALAASAALFGLAHLLNPQHSLMGALSIITEAGLTLGAIFVLTGRLWACIGAHSGWNFAQGYIFGAKVSGTDAGGHWLSSTPHPGVSDFLTGGIFGPEASLSAILCGTLAGVALLLLARRKPATPQPALAPS